MKRRAARCPSFAPFRTALGQAGPSIVLICATGVENVLFSGEDRPTNRVQYDTSRNPRGYRGTSKDAFILTCGVQRLEVVDELCFFSAICKREILTMKPRNAQE